MPVLRSRTHGNQKPQAAAPRPATTRAAAFRKVASFFKSFDSAADPRSKENSRRRARSVTTRAVMTATMLVAFTAAASACVFDTSGIAAWDATYDNGTDATTDGGKPDSKKQDSKSDSRPDVKPDSRPDSAPDSKKPDYKVQFKDGTPDTAADGPLPDVPKPDTLKPDTLQLDSQKPDTCALVPKLTAQTKSKALVTGGDNSWTDVNFTVRIKGTSDASGKWKALLEFDTRDKCGNKNPTTTPAYIETKKGIASGQNLYDVVVTQATKTGATVSITRY